ncbi:hypothetical protein HBI25_224550 [Parastagonospora nodorum]|nr:hypothetical protein HBH51_190970 [Parastagonospora nodorum]KAH4983465.1 hypothetical protein HBI76_150970 [Parastagonospora nodorum]KAH5301374.1 hypothetical protein HBI12_187940 [Parastagonospora nodorum]KAH5325005.1 hypothetical protein HBI11_022110 [Parastagonospora nodorum]KAH5545235.1 hypothetical protein HBI25_224550 [Parastagonospora nodorum]
MKLTHHLAALLVCITPTLASTPRSIERPETSPYGYSPAALPEHFEMPHIDSRGEGASDVSLACDLFLSRGADVFVGMSKEECMAAMGGFVKEARKGKSQGEWMVDLKNLVMSLEGREKRSKS